MDKDKSANLQKIRSVSFAKTEDSQHIVLECEVLDHQHYDHSIAELKKLNLVFTRSDFGNFVSQLVREAHHLGVE